MKEALLAMIDIMKARPENCKPAIEIEQEKASKEIARALSRSDFSLCKMMCIAHYSHIGWEPI